MEVKDLLGLKEPLVKLLDVVASGTGILYEPTRIKRRAEAEADAFNIKIKSIEDSLILHPEATALVLLGENENLKIKDVSDLGERALSRQAYCLTREQENLENVILSSIKYLDEEVSAESVDPDWRARFFSKAKYISHEQMQEVWGRILAGEVSNPGSFSLRSIEVLSNLTHSEAELFSNFSHYVDVNNGCALISKGNPKTEGFNDEFNYVTILKLQDCGLLIPKEDLVLNQDFNPNQKLLFKYKHGSLVISNLSNVMLKERLQVLYLTSAGKELMNLINPKNWESSYLSQLKVKYPRLDFTFIKQ